MLLRSIETGSALAKLKEIVRWQGGDPSAIEDRSRLPHAQSVLDLPSPATGYVTWIDAEAIGFAAMTLGAGREKVDGKIDPAVGLVLLRKVGDPVRAGEPLVQVHYNKDERLEAATMLVLQAFRFSTAAPTPQQLILERLR